MPNDKILPASPGPDIALRQSDAEEMQRAMKGVTTGRATGMARTTAEKEMKKDKQYHNFDGAHGKHTGAAEDMHSGGANESRVVRQNAPLRDLHKSGHDLNHTYKTPVASVSPDVKAAGTNHSYLHPHSHAGMREVPRKAFEKANVIKPVSQMGTGKT